jgi:LmbE family N-acetylglucosaminyl deacetylase
MSSSTLLWNLENLKNIGAVLYLAAHPDDENTRLISYLANERHIRTAYLSLTRGDGGQNLIGSEKGPLLGMIRTQELLAARRTDHGTQFFSRAYDFGYSKNPEETFHFWNKDSVLADAVWVIRTFKPDVIVCRFPTTGEGGHGHHTASAIIAEEAFQAAADPTKFPQQLKYTTAWQAKRIVWNTFNFGGNNTTAPDQLKIDVGDYNVLLGKYNGEIASESRTMHKSQGFGTEKSRGSQVEYFKHIKGDEAKNDLLEGVDVTWNRYAATKNLDAKIAALIHEYQFTTHENFLNDLLQLLRTFETIKTDDAAATHQIALKKVLLQKIILGYCEVWLDATTSTAMVTRGETIPIKYSLLNSGKQPVMLLKISTINRDTNLSFRLGDNKMNSIQQQFVLPENTPYSTPYWLQTFPEKGMFQVHDVLRNTNAENAPSVVATFLLKIQQDTFSVSIPVRYKKIDPVKGEVYQPLLVVPKIAVDIPYKNVLFTNKNTKTIPVKIVSYANEISGKLAVKAPQGWQVKMSAATFQLKGKGSQTIIPVEVTPTENSTQGNLKFSVVAAAKKFTKTLTAIEYDHIPNQLLLQPATVHLQYEAITIPQLKVGYIPGAGDDVAALLKELNMDVTLLNNEQLVTSDLKKFDVIIAGVRAFNTNETLQQLHDKLMDYVAQGGNFIVQYNTNSRLGPMKSNIGPYKFEITRERVTDETAPISFLQPAHPALNSPNKITKKDFDGWIQERGIYFAGNWDGHYQPLLRMNDPHEKPNDGSLIVARYGKGNFVYTGLVFFRELPAGVPGAYKLLLNLMALPKEK